MFRILWLTLICAFPALSSAGTLLDRDLAADGADGSRDRIYQLYVPDDLPSDGTAPLVTVLHGCRQTQTDMVEQTRFRELADENGFAVLYPFVTSYLSSERRNPNCWGFWFDEHQHEGQGEPGDIRRMMAAAEGELGTDPSRRYIAGLSSGAAMSVVMAVVYSEDIAAAGSVAGLSYAEDPFAVTPLGCIFPYVRDPVSEITSEMSQEQTEEDERRLVPLMVMQSIHDCTVQIGNGETLAASWINYYDADPNPTETQDCSTVEMPCEQARFLNAAGETVVETVFYEGPTIINTHFWPGDGSGDFANPDGPSGATLLWNFFSDKQLDN